MMGIEEAIVTSVKTIAMAWVGVTGINCFTALFILIKSEKKDTLDT